MADVVHDDVAEQILIELEVKDLIRCKSVCKSWYSLITSSRFIKRHLTRSYNKDRYNNNLGRRLITSSYCGSSYHHCLVGSSNGLVCIYYRESCTVVVGNPLTRESRQHRLPNGIGRSFYWAFGFGYDSSTNDYKVIVGGQDVPYYYKTWFQVLSLKSNVWKVVGEVKCAFRTRFGILCNGALHWLMMDNKNKKQLIVCYDLAKEEFREIPQPDDARYKECMDYYSYSYSYARLSVMKECLCVYDESKYSDAWLMKKYNVKQSWEMLPRDHGYINNQDRDIVHCLSLPKDESFFKQNESWFSDASGYRFRVNYDYLIFVQSLVSPHVS